MATSSKSDQPSDSPDRPLSNSGQRGSHIAAQLDRPSGFHESMENSIVSSLPNMTRSSSVVAQGDVLNFFQCLSLNLKMLATNHKCSHKGDFKRHINVALGISGDDSPSVSPKSNVLPSPLPGEIKRVKAGLRKSCVKARERVEIFNETLSVFNKIFPTLPSKKRSRAEIFVNGRPNALLRDRTVLGQSINKRGIQNQAATCGFELEHQRTEKRTKTSVPTKRTRTSLVDVRSNNLVRSSSSVDRDRQIPRLAGNGTVQADNRTLSISVDGWKKTKMKKKRSGTKPDVSPSLSTKPADCHWEAKQGMQQRPLTDARSRLSVDSLGVRPGVANGDTRVGKPDGISQPNGLTIRLSNPKADLVNNSPPSDRRECSDKEKVNIRAANKLNFHDDFPSASPASTTKKNPSVRAPRSGSVNALKLYPVVHKATASGDWELSNSSKKPPTFGVNNRKHTALQSAFPPVAHWAGQRPQKISRSATRTSLRPAVSNNDEIPILDTGSDVSDCGTGAGSAGRLTSSYPQHVKLKSDSLPSTVLPESEESGVPEIKYNHKGRKSNEIDEKVIQNVQKVANPSMQSRKNNLSVGKDIGDGLRKRRIGRNFTSRRSFIPLTVEKPASAGTAKQLRSAGRGFEKTESKTRCLPTRKFSDHKAYTCQKHATAHAAAADFLDDGHEELLAAASSVINAAHALSSSFWKQMEPIFGFISDMDIAYLKQMRNYKSTGLVPTPISSDEHNCITPNRNEHARCEREMENATGTQSIDILPGNSGHEARGVSLCQRLLASMISEDDLTHGIGELESNSCGTEFELDGESERNCTNYPDNFEFSAQSELNGQIVTGKQGYNDIDFHISGAPNYSNLIHSFNGVLSDQKPKPDMTCSQVEYDSMCISEKVLLEVQSIGIMPNILLEDEGISREIRKLEDMWCWQVAKKNSLVDKLWKSASEMKVQQEKEFVQHAHDKLVAMAYEKYMTCWGLNATGGKSSGNKMTKQAALTFIKQTLERCQKYEDTGDSCFHQPMLKDIFLLGSEHPSGALSLDISVDEKSAKLYVNNSCSSSKARVSDSMGSQPSPQTSQFGQSVDNHIGNFCDLLPPINHFVEQGLGKEHTRSSRVKKRELLLDDVGGNVGTSSSLLFGIGGSLSGSTKGKRSERDREGKGHNREVLCRSETNRTGWPALSNAKGERKSKAKPKQKTAHQSVSMKGLVKQAEQPKRTLHLEPKSREINSINNAKERDGFGLELEAPIDLSHLQLPGIDDLGDTQGQDLGSWLNIDDDGLHDHDYLMGLEIPMDDLSDLNMMV